MRLKIALFCLAALLLLSACNLPNIILPSFLGFLGTDTPTPTNTPTATATFTPTPTFTATFTPTSTSTSTPTATETPTATPTPTRTLRPYVPPTSTGSDSSGGSDDTGSSGGGSDGCPSYNSGYEAQVISLVNSERLANGLSALSANGSITASAESWSVYMATNNVFYHSSSFPAGGGENIAAGYGSPGEVVSAWMNSPGHRDNILGAYYNQVGAGYAYCAGSEYGSYWTLQFGP